MHVLPRFVMTVLATVVVVPRTAAQPISPTEPVRLSAGPHLLIDDDLVEHCEGLVRTTHQPVKQTEPILGPRVLWHLKVLQGGDDERAPFRMWYIDMTPTEGWSYAYAESTDGLHWRLPQLGIHKVGGSKANNIVKVGGAYCLCLVDHKNECSDPTKRYVLLYYQRGEKFCAAYSPDGLHWTDDPRNPIFQTLNTPAYRRMEDRLSGCWDPLRKCYLVTTGYTGKPEDGFVGKPPFHAEGHRRMVGQTTSRDLQHWTPFRPIVVEDPEKPGFWETYGMKPTVRGRLYLGFLRVLRDDLPADAGGPVRGIGWTELCTSRDGEHWTRHSGVFLDRNHEPGTWDHAMAWVGDVITVGDKEYVYYGGYAEGHKVGPRQVGVATLRKDGFVSRDAGPTGGTLRTRPLLWDADGITVNAKVSGELRVRVLAESGLPVPGFLWRDCTPIQGDSLSHRIRWKGDPRILKGKRVRFEFSLRDTELYGFEAE